MRESQRQYNHLQKYQESSCSCKECSGACTISPCLGTPEDMLALLKAGYGNNLQRGYARDPKTKNKVMILSLTASKWMDEKRSEFPFFRCSMLSPEGLCMLHNTGLKPTEGSLTKCRDTDENTKQLRHDILFTWRSIKGRMIQKIIGTVEKKELAWNKEIQENLKAL